MIFAIRIDILSPPFIVLQGREGANQIMASIEDIQHRFVYADKSVAHLIPAGDAAVVGLTKRYPPKDHPLRDRRSAIAFPACRISHAIGDVFITLTAFDAGRNLLGSHFEPDVRSGCPIPLAIANQRPRREPPAIGVPRSIAHCVPSHGKWLGRSPVECRELEPMVRDREWSNDVLIGRPAIEESAGDRVPIT